MGAGVALAIALVPAPVQAAERLDRRALQGTLDAVHRAGMYGTYSAVRDRREEWRGAAGVADVRTRRPVRPDMEHRVGSITKTFTAAAVLQQVERGQVDLDAPIGRYLPRVVPGERGRQVTVRMLLNHTSGIADYIGSAFPSLQVPSGESLDAHRVRRFRPEELVRYGLAGPPTNAPGQGWSYSNTNYVIAGLLLERVTGTPAEAYITRHVIRPAGLKRTYFPATPFIRGPHARMYENLYGYIDPPRDYSVYDMSWAGTAGAVVATMDDLNRFYRALLTGRVIGPAALAQMRRTVPVTDPDGNVLMRYGLGLYALDLPCGEFWGHDGAVFGAGTQSLSDAAGNRQLSVGLTLMKYQRLDEPGNPLPHPADNALGVHMLQALCGDQGAQITAGGPAFRPLPLQHHRR
ncbi:serine hydrolase domain-containing protein [Actinomadura craniellae]|uniref:serine hydrolase domain-containing protein n=1 Tax=Actinomadura craniellae TaxID=2231787 RepID=UPI001F2AA0B3|nr:serine hydrolase domain-containing protein [Actinomadura craniellae]